MPREKMFRAFDVNSKKMITEFDMNSDGVPVKNESQYDKRTLEIMDYIGLRDKNGEEIYECDIVQFPDSVYPRNREIKFVDAGYEPFNDPEFMFDASDCEVVGNSFENAHLLIAGNE